MRTLLLLFLASASSAVGAVAFVQAKASGCAIGSSSAATLSCVFTSTPTVGNDIIVTFTLGTGAIVAGTSVGDIGGNTYTGSCVTVTRRVCTYRAHNIAAISDKTVTVTIGGTSSKYVSMGIAEYSGLSASIRTTATGAETGSSPVTCGTMAATSGDLVICVLVSGLVTSTITPSSGFTTRSSEDNGAGGLQVYAMEDQIVGSTTNYSPQFTLSGVSTLMFGVGTVFPPAGAVITPIRHRVTAR